MAPGIYYKNGTFATIESLISSNTLYLKTSNRYKFLSRVNPMDNSFNDVEKISLPAKINGEVYDGSDYVLTRGATGLTEFELPTDSSFWYFGGFDSYGGAASSYPLVKSITIPNNITSLGGYLVYGTAIEHLEIPGSVKTIYDVTFANCTSLKTIKINEGTEELQNSLFNGCTSLEEIELPSTLTTISDYLFPSENERHYLSNLNTIIYPGDLEIKNLPSAQVQVIKSRGGSTMATKTIVTKERLAYYDQKIKAEIAKKGDIKQVKIGGNSPISPDSNGVLNLPDNLVEGFSGGDASLTYPMSLRYYYKDGTDANMRDTLVLGADSTDATLFHIKQNTYNVDDSLDQGTGDYVLPTQAYVDNKAAALTGSKFQKVSAIPDAATATDGVIYLVPNTSTGNNVFDEYFRVNLGTDSEPNYAMEKVGSTAIDLSGYVEESDLVEITTAEIDEFFTPTVTP